MFTHQKPLASATRGCTRLRMNPDRPIRRCTSCANIKKVARDRLTYPCHSTSSPRDLSSSPRHQPPPCRLFLLSFGSHRLWPVLLAASLLFLVPRTNLFVRVVYSLRSPASVNSHHVSLLGKHGQTSLSVAPDKPPFGPSLQPSGFVCPCVFCFPSTLSSPSAGCHGQTCLSVWSPQLSNLHSLTPGGTGYCQCCFPEKPHQNR